MSSIPKLDFVEATETSISVKVAQSSSKFILQWKQQSQPSWAEGSGIGSKLLPAGTTDAQADDLEPGTTYCLRLVDEIDSAMIGPELVVDTEQVGCTPGQKQGGCCTIS